MQTLVDREQELVIARNTMVSMFNGITAGIAYISKEYKIIHANRAYEDLFKGSEAGRGGQDRCYEVFGQREEPCEDCPGTFAMRSGTSETVERELVLPDRKKHVLWVHAYPVRDHGNAPVGFVEYVLDITEQRNMQNELKRYAERLEEMVEERTCRLKEAQVQMVHQEKMAALGQMAAGVAHEIGNPLSALSSLVRALGKRVGYDPACEGKIRFMQEQIDRIARIVREMTDFSRPASYGKRLTHINEVIRTALGIARYDERLKHVHVITSLDTEIPALKLDGDRLLQVFLNVIFNAGDAMKGRGTMTIISRREDRSVQVIFEDTGPGIPGEYLSHVFEPFFTTKEVGAGTGLGLSVSYGIMQGMGGTIRVSNREEGGSVFTVEIPMAAR